MFAWPIIKKWSVPLGSEVDRFSRITPDMRAVYLIICAILFTVVLVTSAAAPLIVPLLNTFVNVFCVKLYKCSLWCHEIPFPFVAAQVSDIGKSQCASEGIIGFVGEFCEGPGPHWHDSALFLSPSRWQTDFLAIHYLFRPCCRMLWHVPVKIANS